MASRLDLQTMLEEILESQEVYIQPPASIRMTYPAIIYKLGRIQNSHANNSVYKQDLRYEVTLIDRNPDSKFVEPLSRLPKCAFDRFYTSDNLNHWVFTIYI